MMTLGTNVSDKKRENTTSENRVIKKKKKGRTTKSSVPPQLPEPVRPVQNLYLTCKDIFKKARAVPSPKDVHKLCRVLDNIKPEDVGLSSDMDFFKRKSVVGTPRVGCSTIYHCRKFTLCIFFLPPTGVIPLHNHPEMTVFNKLLIGSMHIKSYDWVDSDESTDSAPSPGLRLARKVADGVYTAPCDTSVLYPKSGGNIHAFTAITPCAVLDVLGPPYSKAEGRDGAYYKEFNYASHSDDTSRANVEGEEEDKDEEKEKSIADEKETNKEGEEEDKDEEKEKAIADEKETNKEEDEKENVPANKEETNKDNDKENVPANKEEMNKDNDKDEKDKGQYGWLEEIELPEENEMKPMRYRGPEIVAE